jgi:hypothetical protein
MAERVGFFERDSRNPNEDGLLQLNSHRASNLAFADSFVRFRSFARVFGFCRRNDTRNDTRRERLRGPSGQRNSVVGHRFVTTGAIRDYVSGWVCGTCRLILCHYRNMDDPYIDLGVVADSVDEFREKRLAARSVRWFRSRLPRAEPVTPL